MKTPCLSQRQPDCSLWSTSERFVLLSLSILCLFALGACQGDGEQGANSPSEGLPSLQRDRSPERLPVAPLDQGAGRLDQGAGDMGRGDRPEDDGGAALNDQGGEDIDALASDGEPPGPEPQGPWALQRPCELLLEAEALGAGEVLIAGDFTGWGERPIPMDSMGGGRFELRLSEADGLQPGITHGYKQIVDGQWRVDPLARRRSMEGGCTNGGLRLPDCARPLLEDLPFELSTEGSGEALSGQLEVAIRFQSGTPWSPPSRWELLLNGAPLPAERRSGSRMGRTERGGKTHTGGGARAR